VSERTRPGCTNESCWGPPCYPQSGTYVASEARDCWRAGRHEQALMPRRTIRVAYLVSARRGCWCSLRATPLIETQRAQANAVVRCSRVGRSPRSATSRQLPRPARSARNETESAAISKTPSTHSIAIKKARPRNANSRLDQWTPPSRGQRVVAEEYKRVTREVLNRQGAADAKYELRLGSLAVCGVLAVHSSARALSSHQNGKQNSDEEQSEAGDGCNQEGKHDAVRHRV
jgi:hypothetical protein